MTLAIEIEYLEAAARITTPSAPRCPGIPCLVGIMTIVQQVQALITSNDYQADGFANLMQLHH